MKKHNAKQILDRWPSLTHIARGLGKSYDTVHRWRYRNRIPGEHDLELIRLAREDGVELTLEELAHARAATPEPGAYPPRRD